MDLFSLIDQLNRKPIQPVYTLVTDESYIQELFTTTLENRLTSEGLSFENVRIDMDNTSLSQVLEEVNLFSFFSDCRLVLVDGVDFTAPRPKNKLSKNEEKALYNYLDNPNQTSILVWLILGKVDGRKKLGKELKKNSVWLDFSSLSDQEVENYLKRYVSESGLNLSNEAFSELVHRIDFNLSQGVQEIEKLKLYSTSTDSVGVEVVKTLVPRALESDVFELSNAVVRRDYKKAVEIYEDLLLLNNEPVGLHALLVSQFRIMLQSSLLADKGYNQSQIAKELNVHPYRVKLALQNARVMSLVDLADFYNQLADVDYKMKTGVGDQKSHFYILLTKLMRVH